MAAASVLRPFLLMPERRGRWALNLKRVIRNGASGGVSVGSAT